MWVLLLFSVPTLAQRTTVYTEAYSAYKRGDTFFKQNLFAKAQDEFRDALDLVQPVNEPEADLIRMKSELGIAKAAVRLGLPEGEKLILEFIRKYQPDAIASQALIEIANFYFEDNQYDKAIEYYGQISTSALSRDDRSEVQFRMGYAYFVNKDFAKASANFRAIKDIENEYYYPTNYYLGLTYFYEGNYDRALSQFRLVERSKKYDDFVPYYQAQIYFAQRRFDELITYAETRLSGPSVKKEKEFRQLLGQAYFEKGDYQRALPHLEYYAEGSRLREEEFYQLGYTQYVLGKYEAAVKSLREISGQDSPVGQSANFYLADSYLRTGDRASARSAFGNARRMSYDAQMTEEANFNYAKISYELGDPREAIAALQTITPTSRYYIEAQELMGQIFLTYRDYEQAMAVLERIPQKTPQLQEAYQRVTFLRGLQLLQEEKNTEASLLFQRSLQTPLDSRTRAQAIYWLGDIANREEKYDQSIQFMNQFLTLAKTIPQLPDESSLFTGNYLQGYNYLKQENYPAALDYFQATVDGIRRNVNFISSANVRDNILGDATLRTGDAYFKRNQYDQAVQYYDQAVNSRYTGFIYALFQKAVIEGLRGRTADKLLALEQIARDFPRSEYADDALFQLGVTYQQIGQLNRAVAPLKALVEQYKQSSDLVNEALLQLGLVNYNLGNQEAAINYYKQVFGNNPSTSEANRALAALEEIYIQDMGRADLYFAFLETIPGYKVDNVAKDSINFRAAEAQFENANYQRAIEAFTDYIRRYPNGQNTLTAYYHRGESHAVLRMYSQALADYEYVISRGNSRFYLKALEKGALIAYNSEQDFNKSFQLYQQLMNVAPSEDIRFEATLGSLRSAYRIGNTQAVYDLAGRVANSGNATQAQKATANFYLGKIAFDRREYANALKALNETIRMSDNEQTAEARYLKAAIYYQQRDLNTAQQLTMEANKESSAYPYWVAKSVMLLSDILRDKNDLYNARAALEALLENYNEDQQLVAEAKQKLAQLNQMINSGSRLDRTQPGNNLLELDNGGN